MLIKDIIFIEKKATHKADGCYRIRGIAYRVRDGRVTHYADEGTIFEIAFGFMVEIGKYEGYAEEAQKVLRKIKKD